MAVLGAQIGTLDAASARAWTAAQDAQAQELADAARGLWVSCLEEGKADLAGQGVAAPILVNAIMTACASEEALFGQALPLTVRRSTSSRTAVSLPNQYSASGRGPLLMWVMASSRRS